jgi:hypothetical protein
MRIPTPEACICTLTSSSLRPLTDVPSSRRMTKLPDTSPFAAAVYNVSGFPGIIVKVSAYHIQQCSRDIDCTSKVVHISIHNGLLDKEIRMPVEHITGEC